MLTSYTSRLDRQYDQSYNYTVCIREARVPPPQLDFTVRPNTLLAGDTKKKGKIFMSTHMIGHYYRDCYITSKTAYSPYLTAASKQCLRTVT